MKQENDDIIRYIIENMQDVYDIREDGSIWSKRCTSGNLRKEWRRCDGTGSKVKYKRISITAAGKRYTLTAHRMVYQKYIGELEAGVPINHIDGDKHNNHPNNLEKASHSINNLHAYMTGLRNPVINGRRKYTTQQVDKMRRLYKEGKSLNELSKIFDTSKGHVHDIVNNRVYKKVSEMTVDERIIKVEKQIKKYQEQLEYLIKFKAEQA